MQHLHPRRFSINPQTCLQLTKKNRPIAVSSERVSLQSPIEIFEADIQEQKCLSPKAKQEPAPKVRKLSYIDYSLKLGLTSPKGKCTDKDFVFEKSAILEIPSLYKKSFKYNTTIHQMVKKFTKPKQQKNVSTEQKINANKIIKLEFLRLSNTDSKKVEFPLKRIQLKQKNKSLERNDKIRKSLNNRGQTHSNRCSDDNEICSNHIQFLGTFTEIENEQKWKSTHSTFGRLTVKNDYRLGANSKPSFSLEKSSKNPYTNPSKVNALFTIRENFKKDCEWNDLKLQRQAQNKEVRNLVKSQTQPKQKISISQEQELETVKKIRRQRNKKFTTKIKNVQSLEFNVDAWKTNEDQEFAQMFST